MSRQGGGALSALAEVGCCETEKEANKVVVDAIKRVASELGNRPAICRKFYVHPAVIDSFVQGSLVDALASAAEADDGPEDDDKSPGLRRLERHTLALLRGLAPAAAAG